MKAIFHFFSSLSLAAAIFLMSGSPAAAQPKPGLQTWTLRNLEFDQVVEFATKHQIKYLQMFAKHIDPKGSPEETRRKKAILDQHGLVCYTIGVTGTSMDQAENRKVFEFAKLMEIKIIVVEPNDFRILDQLEELAKEYDVKVAIHNHGIKSLYGNPLVVKNLIQHRDPRMGVCMDVGWITSAGFDAAKVFRDYEGRVFDVHLKDKIIKKTEGDDVYFDVAIGTGQGNFKGLFQELKKANWDGVLAIETDNPEFARDPGEYVAGALKFLKANLP